MIRGDETVQVTTAQALVHARQANGDVQYTDAALLLMKQGEEEVNDICLNACAEPGSALAARITGYMVDWTSNIAHKLVRGSTKEQAAQAACEGLRSMSIQDMNAVISRMRLNFKIVASEAADKLACSIGVGSDFTQPGTAQFLRAALERFEIAALLVEEQWAAGIQLMIGLMVQEVYKVAEQQHLLPADARNATSRVGSA